MKTVLTFVIFTIIIGKGVVIGHNADLIEEAYERQTMYLKDWDNYVKEAITAPGEVTLEFTGKLKVKEAFTILQTWRTRIKNDEKKHYTVKIPIAGEIYTFTLGKAIFGRHQTSIIGPHGHMKYKDVFKKLEQTDQRKVAEYMLEASETYIDDTSSSTDWDQKYPFLNDIKKIENNKIRLKELLNEIMVIGQVAEAAMPTKEAFRKWMEIAKKEDEKVHEVIYKKWKDEVDKVVENRKLKMKKFDYKVLLQETGKFTAPDLKKKSIERLKQCFQPADENNASLDEKVYEELSVARKTAIKKGENKYSDNIKGVPDGRVPFADEVFRLTLHRIKSMDQHSEFNNKKLWENSFEEFFPMHRSKGLKTGRFDIFYQDWIREYHLAVNHPPNIQATCTKF